MPEFSDLLIEPGMFDAGALTIVLAGTLLATLAHGGVGDLRAAALAVARLPRPGFKEDANRAALARAIVGIRAKGTLVADLPPLPDDATNKIVNALLRHRSVAAAHQEYRSQRAIRELGRTRAVRTFEHAGELAPVFGLVGTLVAITQLTPGDAAILETTLGSVASAALSTLYGVLAAHLIFLPLARAIERDGEREETARMQQLEWLVAQVEAGGEPLDSGGSVPAGLREVA